MNLVKTLLLQNILLCNITLAAETKYNINNNDDFKNSANYHENYEYHFIYDYFIKGLFNEFRQKCQLETFDFRWVDSRVNFVSGILQ